MKRTKIQKKSKNIESRQTKHQPHNNRKKQRASAFSLLEVLISLAIIGILCCIVYPSYNHHIIKVRRNNAVAALYDIAGKLEEYYMQKETYKGATIDGLKANDLNYKNYYQIDIITATNTTYNISATPVGSQAKSDTICGTLSLDQDGGKNMSGSGTVDDCWF